jgi:hypothetical protein
VSNHNDNLYAAFASFVGTTSNGYYRLDVSTTAATFDDLPKGRYVVRMTGGPELIGIATGATATDPSSNNLAGGTGGAFASGDTYVHESAADASAIVLGGSGSGRLYLVKIV